jgi:hypothetical protein
MENYKKITKKHVVEPFKKNTIIASAICLIILSSLLLFILLVGSLHSVYLSKFVFDEPIQALIKKQEISFTLYSYCIDNSCPDPSFKHNFDQIPSVGEIVGDIGNLFNKRLDPNDIGNKIGDTANKVGKDIGGKAEEIVNKAKEILPQMVDGIKNFKPQIPTINFVGLFSIPYLVAFLINIIIFVLFYFGLNIFVIILLLFSAFFNAFSLIFDILLFRWVFQVIASIPGFGKQHTGPGIHLAAWSLIFLIIATVLMIVGVCSKMRGGNNNNNIIKQFRGNKLTPNKEQNQETSVIV